MKSRQFCSVCKQWLDMEVVPTGDGDDDGVVWFRCPQCQGFLPKLGVAASGGAGDAALARSVAPADVVSDDAALFDAAALADIDALAAAAAVDDDDDHDDADDDDVRDAAVVAPSADDEDLVGRPALPLGAHAEPLHEYAAMLAAVDPEQSVPYRPWESYEVGQCILHLAWNDCGVVVAKERLPGGRQVIKCWFQGAGVVRLIENTPR